MTEDTHRVLSRFLLLTTLALFTSVQAAQAQDCTLRSCKGGGILVKCYSKMKLEAADKRKRCAQLRITSGVSAYAMATSLPGVCIERNAVIRVHMPWTTGRVYGKGTKAYTYMTSRMKPATVSYFEAHGGLKRKGFWSNALFLTAVPAQSTGVTICK